MILKIFSHPYIRIYIERKVLKVHASKPRRRISMYNIYYKNKVEIFYILIIIAEFNVKYSYYIIIIWKKYDIFKTYKK